jgi:hypothetical protein
VSSSLALVGHAPTVLCLLRDLASSVTLGLVSSAELGQE